METRRKSKPREAKTKAPKERSEKPKKSPSRRNATRVGGTRAPVSGKSQRTEDVERPDKIRTNRAPVLTLWVAVVAVREGYKFEEGLSFGRAIAGLFAVSKARRLGLIEKEEGAKKARKREEDVEMFEVFGMRIAGKTTKEGLRLAGQKGKVSQPSTAQNYLRRAFGQNYEVVKEAMESLAKAYPAGKIGGVAYSLYSEFRPEVRAGVGGWGAKGLLDLNVIRKLSK